MAIKLPEQTRAEKASSVIQLICFIVIFVVIYLGFQRFAKHIIIWGLLLVADYIVTSLLVFLVIRPLITKIVSKQKPKK
ncbi:MAG: hypothetical protein IJ060_10320 [Oscillospiraceae bacterium]|nr:hypothetical protein [Oscillospiraceae bacterium]